MSSALTALTVYSWKGRPQKSGTVYGRMPSKMTSIGTVETMSITNHDLR